METELTPLIFVAVVFIALLCQFLSVSLGVGYGTPLTPVLLIMGFTPLNAVPAVLLSQLAGGVVGGLVHHRVRNIELDFRRDDKLVKERLRGLGYLPRSKDAKVVFILVSCGIIGVIVGVLTAISIPEDVLAIYIGAMVLTIGLVILFRRNSKAMFSWKGIITVGVLGAFNKGISGGGYVPLVTGGQIISGHEIRSSVGITTVAIAILCAVGFSAYLIFEEGSFFWWLAAAASIGSVIAAPFAALTTKRINTERLRLYIGLALFILGALTLVATFLL